jgi:hypothetical protein
MGSARFVMIPFSLANHWETAMSRKSDLLEEREGVLKVLFGAIFDGLKVTTEQFNTAVHHLGTINILLERCDDDE